ncbi:poly(ADP-ribose) polymerase family member 14-related sequence 3 isoform X2 [Siphateles boraxobius]|uniref:poly(ADP-ribose) polymerase family member 14-related sequence 3 isoform X2 n=1 Tax=Siphateles boraxobius TaxID=180520 RepID=UPI004062AB0D
MEERSLILEGLPDDFDRVKSRVELYFKNKRRSGGEIEQIREHQDDKRKALLIYMSEEDLKKVLDKRIHKVDFKSKGAVEVTVKLPEDTKSKKIKPQVLPKPKLEKNALLKSLPAPANQVSEVTKPATEIKDNEEDSEIPDLLITTPSLTSVDKETLQMYFEQFTEQFELAKHGNNSWILKLYSQSDFKRIFGKEEHDIGVSLQVYNEGCLGEKSDPRRFILTGFDGDTDCKKISVFIGSCSKTTEYTWETLDDDDRIVVTFKQDIDVKSFIRKCTSKQLQGRDIGVTRMERTDSVLVRGGLEKISEEILTLYFSNKKKSRGGEIENFIWINRRTSAVITFGNCDDAHAVVEQKHSVCGTDVQASLFYSTLQKALTGEKPTLTDTTTKVNISVSEDLLLFFETNKRCRTQLESDAKLLHAKVFIDSTASEMILEMDVNKESLTALQIAPTWESKIMRGIESFLSGYDTEELKVEEDVWRKVEKDCDVLVTVDTAFSFKERDSKVVISGVKEQVRILSDKIGILLNNAAVEVEVERNTIEARIQLDCKETFDLIKERVQSKLGQVSLSHDEKQHIISLKGLKEKVNSVEMLIKNAQKNILTHQLKLSSHLIDFLNSLDILKFEQDNHIPARFINRKDFFGILVEKENLKGAVEKIGEILKEEVMQISPNQNGDALTRFLRNLPDEMKKANDIRIAQSNMQVIICGLSNAVADVTGKVRRYLENKEPTTENVPLKSVREVEFVDSSLNLSDLPELKRLGASILAYKASNSPCLKVTAPKDNIKDAVDVVQQTLSSIVVEKLKYRKAGEAKVLEKLEDNIKTKAREKQCNLYLSQEHIIALPKSFTHKISDFVTLSVIEGDLHHFTADALVCTMNGNLDFKNPVAQRFLKFGGDKISEVCKTPKKEKQSLLPGDVLVSDAGKLNAETLIYAVLPQKGQALDSNYLQSSVRNCLLTAEGKGCGSIAMPAIGCETFGFSVKESCMAIRAAVLQFCSEHHNSPKNIRNISVLDSDEKIVEEYNALIQELGFPDMSTKIPLQSWKLKHGSDKRVRINGVPIFLKKGDITKETVDVIVNSSNKSLDLNTGVSGAILKAAGKSVVDECKKQAPLKAGSAVMTSAGALQCKNIAQMVGPENIADITASLEKVLNLCEGKMATTLAIPAIGTGRGGFEPKESIKAILTAIERHLQEPNSSCFRSITIVAFNQKIFDDFRDYFKVWNKPARNKMPENQVKIGSVRIEVKKGDITTETVRGIVNTTNRDMSLRGGVSGAVFKAAGASVEQECQTHGPLQNDVAAVTSGGNLQCDVIMHMVGPHTAAEIISRVKKVLERCEEKQITTLSFPAVGTGGGGVQAADAIAAMLEAFEDHLTPNVPTVIKLIYIVINQDNILQEFQKGLKTWAANAQESEDDEDEDGDDEYEDYSSIEESLSSDQEADASANPMEMIIGPIKVKVFSGDITKETVEAIVNSTNTSLNLNSGVSGAILKASGQTVVNECKTKAPQPADGVILTKAGNLSNIKHIVQMVGQTSEKGISSSMYKVLTMCEENHIQSVSFPALGTGAGNLAASGVANAMTEALMKFVKDSPKHLKVVHIVIFQAKLLPDFQEAVKKCKKISRKASVPQQTPVTRTKQPTLCLARETASVSFPVMSVDVYGTSHANLAYVKRILDELISDECVSKDIQSRHIADLPETDKKNIVSISRVNQISVLVSGLDKLTVSGKKDDVLDAVLKINGFIQAARDRETRAGEVTRLRDVLCWERLRGERWESLDNSVSYDIELAFHRKLKSFQYQENGESYTVNFSEMKLTNSKQESCRIKRTLLGDSETAIIHPPSTWTKMSGQDLEIITLQSDSAEYKKIKTAFLSSSLHPDVSPVQVQQIDRIQSQSQWQRYCVLKQAVDKKYPKQKNERMLYHGTTKDICQKINKNGFNRSFCGRNAVVHGDGTYFAREAWYSCQDHYSNPDDRGLKYIYRARVVTGSLCKSRQGMKEPDPIRPGDPRAGLHDCAVDSLQNPFIFVVFCDAGAYPEYLITFKSI